MALEALTGQAWARPGDPLGQHVLLRSHSAGATHAFAAACRDRGGVSFSFRFPVDARIEAVVDLIPQACWAPAIESCGDIRDGA